MSGALIHTGVKTFSDLSTKDTVNVRQMSGLEINRDLFVWRNGEKAAFHRCKQHEYTVCEGCKMLVSQWDVLFIQHPLKRNHGQSKVCQTINKHTFGKPRTAEVLVFWCKQWLSCCHSYDSASAKLPQLTQKPSE